MLVSSPVMARDCLKESTNHESGLKFTYSFNDLYETHRDNPDLQKICKDKNKNDIWKDESREINKGYQNRRAELNKNHKIESEDDLFVTEDEICTEIDKKVKKELDCYHPLEYANKLRTYDVNAHTFEENCLKLGPEIIRRIKECKNKL